MRNTSLRRGASRAAGLEAPNANRTLIAALAALTSLTLLFAARAKATDYYVSPSGTTSTAAGTGSASTPWALATALAQPSVVHGGDTIWVAGGTYRGTFTSYLTGTSSAPIVVRAMAGARATIDGGNSNGAAILVVGGAYTWYWGLEVMSSDTLRQSSQDGSWPTDIGRGECVQIVQTAGQGVGTKFINMVVHDGRQGFSWWKEATDSEVHGSLVYYNGWKGATDRGHGHGLYVQNQTGTKLASDNIVFRNFSHGFHSYGSDTAFLNNIQYVGNTAFSNGDLGGAYVRNLLTGGGVVAQSPVWDANMTWAPWGNEVNGLGYAAGCANARMTNNYLVGASKAVALVACTTGLTMTGNSFIAQYAPDGFTVSSYPGNTSVTTPPTGINVFVRKNRYEAGRANVTVYAWDNRSSASVDVSSVLTAGATYEVRNAQNFFGAPVASGTYGGGAITIPLANLAPAAPAGMSAPAATGPQFNAFVVLTTSGGGGGGTGIAPVAAFNNAPSAAPAGQAIAFTDHSTGTPTGWSWTFGDGGTSTQQSPLHTYASAGTYSVKLTVTNTSGSSFATQTQTITVPTGTGFFTLRPCRVVDTRNSGGALAAGARRTVTVAGTCGIPAGAKSVAANLTATGASAAGDMRAFPGDLAVAPFVSAVQFRAGKTRAAMVQVALASDGSGRLAVQNDSAGSTNFLLDVVGFFQ